MPALIILQEVAPLPPGPWTILLGPVGLLVGALLALYIIVKGNYAVPTRERDAAEARETRLQVENEKQTAQLTALHSEKADLRVEVARLTAEAKARRTREDHV